MSMTRTNDIVARLNRAALRGVDARLIKSITGLQWGAVNGTD
jgi:hypothetical protein